jgi:hypothetical protein
MAARCGVIVAFALAGCASSGGMPNSFTVRWQYNGGNCDTITGVDRNGVASGSHGCESGATDYGTRVLDATARRRLVAALDRLRRTRETVPRHCTADGGLSTLTLVERSGQTRRWVFCETTPLPEWPSPRARLLQLVSPLQLP